MTGPGMLDGIRVLDLCEEPGWLAGRLLAELGADVVAVEPPGGDRRGRRGPYLGGRSDPERSLPWLALQTSKRGITLSLRDARGCALLRRLAERADVVLETFRPGLLERRGVGWDDLRGPLPRLVWCSLTPFGRSGPRARWRASDLVVAAMGGSLARTGDPDRPPVRCTLPTAYLHGGAEAAAGVAMALLARERSGRGQLVDVSLQEAQLATRARSELQQQAPSRRIPLAPCNDASAISAHPQLRARGFFTTLEYPELGATLEHPAFFARSSRCAIGVRRRAPRVGEHNAEIYGELGLGADELAALARERVV